MSVELPEAKILADQMNEKLQGKRVKSYELKDYERLQKIEMMDKDLGVFELLMDGVVESAVSRGNTIRVDLDNGSNLVIAPEYGGKVLYHPTKKTVPEKFHLKVNFDDDTALTVRITSMGLIHAAKDTDLEGLYVYARDFNPYVLSPIDEEFTFERFSELLADRNRMLKSVLVGREAVVVGLSNSAFQDVIYRAKLHPKRKASELSEDEKRALYDAIKLLVEERLKLKGKDRFLDLYGEAGGYTPAMGPNMKQKTCPSCGAPIEKLSVGGGDVYLCPTCQV